LANLNHHTTAGGKPKSDHDKPQQTAPKKAPLRRSNGQRVHIDALFTSDLTWLPDRRWCTDMKSDTFRSSMLSVIPA
jgi:hypothetical protein